MSRFVALARAVVVVFVAGCSAAAPAPTTAPLSVADQAAVTAASAATPARDTAREGPAAATPAPAAAPAALSAPAANSDSPVAPPTASVAALTVSSAAPTEIAAPIGAAGDAPLEAAALPDGTIPIAAQPAVDPSCDDTSRPDPLPAPGSTRSQDFFRSFRTPLAPAPLYDPPGQPRRIGLQAGHWLNEDVPPELGRLQGGASGGGKQEWEVNLDIAQRTAALLETAGVQVDVLPATVPPRYRANAFVALHADGDPAGQARGFKVARPGFSSLPDVDDRLVDTFNQVYAADTELPRDDEHISLRMRYYYAFNSRRYCHAVAPGVPQAIVEMGYLTSPVDRGYLIGDPDKLAHGLADSIETFLNTLP